MIFGFRRILSASTMAVSTIASSFNAFGCEQAEQGDDHARYWEIPLAPDDPAWSNLFRQPSRDATASITKPSASHKPSVDYISLYHDYYKSQKFSAEARNDFTSLIANLFSRAGYYYDAAHYAEYLLQRVPIIPTSAIDWNSYRVVAALAVSGWSNLRLGKLELAELRFSQLEQFGVSYVKQVGREGHLAIELHKKCEDWEESFDWQENLRRVYMKPEGATQKPAKDVVVLPN